MIGKKTDEWYSRMTFEEVEKILDTGTYQSQSNKTIIASTKQEKALRELLSEDQKQVETIKFENKRLKDQAEKIVEHFSLSHQDNQITTAQFHSIYPDDKPGTLNKRLSRLLLDKKITRIAVGVYRF